MPNYKIFYRGDTRSPEMIFRQGFYPKKIGSNDLGTAKPFWKDSFCSDSDYIVALSQSFKVASRYPLYSPPTTWVYVVAIDIDQDENHYCDLEAKTLNSIKEDPESLNCGLATLEAEHVVDKVSPHQILSAVPIERFQFANPMGFDFFQIKGPAVKNAGAQEFLQNNKLINEHKKIISQYPQDDTQFINNFTVPPEGSFKYLQRLLYFTRQKFQDDFVEQPVKIPVDEKPINANFFTSKKINSSGIMLSAKQLQKQNKLFFQSLKDGIMANKVNYDDPATYPVVEAAALEFPAYTFLSDDITEKMIIEYVFKNEEIEKMPMIKAKIGI